MGAGMTVLNQWGKWLVPWRSCLTEDSHYWRLCGGYKWDTKAQNAYWLCETALMQKSKNHSKTAEIPEEQLQPKKHEHHIRHGEIKSNRKFSPLRSGVRIYEVWVR